MEKSPLEQIAELSEREVKHILLKQMSNSTMKYHAVYLTSYGHEIIGQGSDSYKQAMEVATSVAEAFNHTIKYIIAKPCTK
jgi:hypothetical protein